MSRRTFAVGALLAAIGLAAFAALSAQTADKAGAASPPPACICALWPIDIGVNGYVYYAEYHAASDTACEYPEASYLEGYFNWPQYCDVAEDCPDARKTPKFAFAGFDAPYDKDLSPKDSFPLTIAKTYSRWEARNNFGLHTKKGGKSRYFECYEVAVNTSTAKEKPVYFGREVSSIVDGSTEVNVGEMIFLDEKGSSTGDSHASRLTMERPQSSGKPKEVTVLLLWANGA